MLKLTCTGGGPCSGTLKLVARVRQGKRTTTVTVGTARYSIVRTQERHDPCAFDRQGSLAAEQGGQRGLKVTLSGSGVKAVAWC